MSPRPNAAPTPGETPAATPAEVTLATPLAAVPGVPTNLAQALAVMGVTNVGKLVAHLPSRHELHEAESTIAEIVPGRIISTRGEVTATKVWPRRPRPRLEIVLHDGDARLEIVWFNMLYLREKIKPGVRLRVQGKAQRKGRTGGLQLINPVHEVLDEGRDDPPLREPRVRPVYPASELIRPWQIEKVVQRVLPLALPLIEDHLSPEFRAARGFPSLSDAYRMMHEPEGEAQARHARRRLAYDELLLLQLGVHLKRAHLREGLRAPALRKSPEIDREIRARFPFTLTPQQDAAIAEIAGDLSRSTPTNRLLQGDVGSGKTVVALYAMLMGVLSRHQAAIMAPTEILAEQHHRSLSAMLAGSKVKVELLTGSLDAADRARIVAGLAQGTVDIVVGTHALLTEDVRFASLAVAVIDEQHRFGVHQRGGLRAKSGSAGTTPHVLVMTATPIPRTLAITLFGDLDISVIDGLPPGRTPVKTKVVRTGDRSKVYERVRARVERGERAFVVVPVIGDDDSPLPGDPPQTDPPAPELLGVRSLMKELEAGPFKGLRLAAMHGRLQRKTRDAVMERFRSGQVQVLVATTVVEVGVDIPDATVMVVEHADRFGLAQLHQLRGRVGRGSKDSVCYLIADAESPISAQRLAVMETAADGFALAEKDFELRGPGELFGTRQSGLPPFKVADLVKDRDLLAMARRDAAEWIRESPALARPGDALARRRLLKAYGEALGLGDVG